MSGFAILVCIVDIEIKAPKKYAPPSPRNIFAFGKLNFRNTTNITISKNKKLAKLLFSFKKLTKNKFTKISNE